MWVAGGPGLGLSEGKRLPGFYDAGCHSGATMLAAGEGDLSLAVIGHCPIGTTEIWSTGLEAVRRRDWSTLTQWPGSYWVLACDSRRQFIAGDLAGLRSVFYAVGPRGLIWSSRAGQIAETLGAGPDLALLTAHVVAGLEHWPTRSVYEGIHQVPAGHGLLVTDGRPALLDVAATAPPRTLDDGAQAVGQALTQAIHDYVAPHDTVSADLSGGLDSSTVVITAVQRRPVRTVTYADKLACAEDVQVARRVAEFTGVEHHVCQGGPLTYHFSHPAPAATDAPTLAAANAGMDAAYLAPVAGMPLHLTGHGGDVVLESSHAAVCDLIAQGHRREAKREVVAWARLRDTAPGPLWKEVHETAAQSRGEALQSTATLLAAGATPPAAKLWSWCRLNAATGWLTPDGRRTVADLLTASAHGNPTAPAGWWDDWASLAFTGAVARNEEPLLAALDVRAAHPFLDNTVVRACLAISPAERRRLGQYKPLLAAARPDLPAWLTGRRSKGSFTPIMLSGLRVNRAALQRLVAKSPLVHAGLVDAAAVSTSLAAAAFGTPGVPLAALHTFLTTCIWLDQHQHAQEIAC
ncbi:asparagine synthase [Streptomyces sp. CB02959]|uniref:asparagine synthase-related protein n=1 Tax=Streptomyces sp. CB02959 TaxID=2020330 RepID=UPI000C27460D|nr:asparagine synthase-related protein [Streptomyces sp. CB02959]PJN32196.1 asparagine synthase [Streptomyces sp. CB02959]